MISYKKKILRLQLFFVSLAIISIFGLKFILNFKFNMPDIKTNFNSEIVSNWEFPFDNFISEPDSTEDLPFVLKGVSQIGEKKISIISFQNADHLYNQGDLIGKYKIYQINDKSVILTHENQLYELKLESNVSQLKNDMSHVDLLWKQTFSDWKKQVLQLNPIPYYIENKVVGFLITKMPQKSVFNEMGLKPGDVIQQINQIDLNKETRLTYCYESVIKNRKMLLKILRDMKIMNLKYEPKEFET